MIIVLKKDAEEAKVEKLKENLVNRGLKLHLSQGEDTTIIGLVGDTTEIEPEQLQAFDVVETVKRIKEPYKKANRSMHPQDSVIDICGKKFGGNHFQVIAGPCSVETREQMVEVAEDVKASGAGLLRGGALKPRTSPYSFQGLGSEGLKLLLEAKKATGLPIVTEIMSAAHLDLFDDVDVIQVGARNMQNFSLLKDLGKVNKPILLKRGMAAAVSDFLMAVEYLIAYGNKNIILCERGIRTFERMTRNTVDINAVALIKELSHFPIIIDASHGTGIKSLVEPVTLAGIMAGADGAMIEVHKNPCCALSDGEQTLDFESFQTAAEKIFKTVEFKKSL